MTLTPVRAALVLVACGVLAACGDSPPPPAEPAPPPAATAPLSTIQLRAPGTAPAPGVPQQTAAAPVPATAPAIVAPVPAPISQRPLSPEQADALAPLFGTWAADLNNCERGAIRISQRRFEGAENGCDIGAIVDRGNWNFVATLSCLSQGQTARERIGMVPLYSPTGEAIALTYFDRGNDEVTVYRCD